MNRLTLAALFAPLAAPAMAHTDTQFHTHGAEIILAVAVVGALVVALRQNRR